MRIRRGVGWWVHAEEKSWKSAAILHQQYDPVAVTFYTDLLPATVLPSDNRKVATVWMQASRKWSKSVGC